MAASTKDLPALPGELWAMILETCCPPGQDVESYYFMYRKFRPVSRLFKEIVDRLMIIRVLPKFDLRIQDKRPGDWYDNRDTEYELRGVFNRLSPTTTTAAAAGERADREYCVFRIIRPYREPRALKYIYEEWLDPYSPPDVEMEFDDNKGPSKELANTFLQAILNGEIRLRIWNYDCSQVPVNVDLVKQEIYIGKEILFGQYFDCAVAESAHWDLQAALAKKFWDD